MTAVDVAAIRAALDKATPGPWETEGEMIGHGDHWVASCFISPGICGPDETRSNAELIVLLRNNAEALLDALDDGYCAGYDHGVEDQMDRQARMEPGRWWRALDTDGDVWCESSSEDEVREMARPSDRVQRLYTSTAGEWRDQPEPVSP